MPVGNTKPMTKAALVNHLVKKTGLSKREVTAVLDALAGTAYKEARRGFTLPGIGKLVVARRNARKRWAEVAGPCSAKDALGQARPAVRRGARITWKSRWTCKRRR